MSGQVTFDLHEKPAPHGLDSALLKILNFHEGYERSIKKPVLMAALKSHGFGSVHERVVRLTINQLRKQGHLICSKGGPNGGYWVAQDWDEVTEFCERELHSRAMDLLQTESALKSSAQKKWGAPQYKLF
jgi:hypothetical protein